MRSVSKVMPGGEFAGAIIDPEGFYRENSPEKISNMLLDNAVSGFEASVDAASLVFAHSVIDQAAYDCCKVTALVAPGDWEDNVSKKQVCLCEVKEKPSYDELRSDALRKFFERFAYESLLTKLDRLHSKCRPEPGFAKSDNYAYDRSRIQELDSLRHDIVHGLAKERKLPKGDDDIDYLWNTSMYLVALVNHRYDVKLDPSVFGAG